MSRPHHPFGCSKWPGLWVCADYAPSSESSEAAQRGTRIHDLFEKLGTESEELDLEAADVTELANAQWAVDQLDELSEAANVDYEAYLESDEPEYFGYADAVFQENTTIHVVDCKSGQGNDYQWVQLVGYAYALMSKDPDLLEAKCHFLYWDRRQVVSYFFSREEVYYTVRRLMDHMAFGGRAKGPQCAYCTRYDSCEEVQHRLKRAWLTDWDHAFDDIEMLKKLKPDLDFLAGMKKRVDAALKDKIDSGAGVEGYQVYTRPGASKADPVATWEALKDRYTLNDILDCCKVDLSKLKALHEIRTGEELTGDYITPGKPITVLRKTKNEKV